MPPPTKKAKFSIENIIAPESPSHKIKFTSNIDLLSTDIDPLPSVPALTPVPIGPEIINPRKRPSVFNRQYGTGDVQNAKKYIEKVPAPENIAKKPEKPSSENIAKYLKKVPNSENVAAKFIEKMPNSDEIEHINDFHTTNYSSRFLIKSLPDDPEALLAGVFKYCADEALSHAYKHFKNNHDHISFTIKSELLDQGPIYAPFTKITDNIIEAVLNMFLSVAQSKWEAGVTLWGSPFTVEVCTVNEEGLPRRRQIRGSGRRRGRNALVNRPVKDEDLIKIQNKNNAHCLFYALQATLVKKVRGLHRETFARYKNLLDKKKTFQKETEALMREVGAPLNKKYYDAIEWVPKVVQYWNRAYAGKHIFKVFIFSSIGDFFNTQPLLVEGPKDFTMPIILYHTRGVDQKSKKWGHFDGVTKMGKLCKLYCLHCLSTYEEASSHRIDCKGRCILCSRMGPGYPCKKTMFKKECNGCHKRFYNEECYKHHKESNFCKHSKRCQSCWVIWDVRSNTRRDPRTGKQRAGHVCGEKYCQKCGEIHSEERGCFIKPYELFDKPACTYIAFDFETTQHEDGGKGRRRHRPNFIGAKIACTNCIDNGEWNNSLKHVSGSNFDLHSSPNLYESNFDLPSSTSNPNGSNSNLPSSSSAPKECKLCGPNRRIAFCEWPFNETKIDDQRVTDNPLEEFVKWLVERNNTGNAIYAYSHNGGRFDMIFVYKKLVELGYLPELIRKGNKLYQMTANGLNIYFRDSYNFFNKPLASLPSMFDLDIADKPYFPHLCNHPDNYGKDIYPTEADYMAGGFMPKKKKNFDEFFAENKLLPFRLEEQLAAYCINDVEILMAALVKFRHEFMDISKRPADKDGLVDRAAFLDKAHKGLDPLREACTIAGACMKMYEANHLPYYLLPRVPERSYNGASTQSKDAHKFFQWYSEENNVTIQTSLSEGGEKQVGPYYLDGWIEEQQLGIEVHGCVWHACTTCFPDDNEILPNKHTVGWTRDWHNERMEYIKERHPNIKEIWECELKEMRKNDKAMDKKFKEYEDYGPIRIRDCFYGGRTGPQQLYYKPAPGEKIYYYDITSLYPWTNMMLDDSFIGYPTCHPIFRTYNKKVNWTEPADNPFVLALMKVRVVPPRQCDVPVLPMRIEGDPRLLFPLCAKCAKLHPKGGLYSNDKKCKHNDFERGWVSNCTSIELDAALREGYKVTKVIRVLDYVESSSKDIFRGYMREFLAEKIHSTGFDKKIEGNKELEEKFILACEEKFGIKIDKEKMKTNKGRRELVKLCLNSLWGRFSLRNGLTQTKITNDPAVFGEFMRRKDIIVYRPYEILPGVILFNYAKKEEWIEEHDSSNVTLSAWTTSCARLTLLKYMQKIVRTPGCKLLYTDTDSVIFVAPEGQSPIPLGDHIGDFTDEYPDHDIVEAVFGGSKQYGLKIRRKDDPSAPFEYVLKIRGISITHDAEYRDGLQYEKFKEMVLNYAKKGKPEQIDIIYPHFMRPSILEGQVFSQPMKKIYRPFVAKGLIDPDTLIVRDFGYSL